LYSALTFQLPGFPRDTKDRTVSRATLIGSANESAFAVWQQHVPRDSAIRPTGEVVDDLEFVSRGRLRERK